MTFDPMPFDLMLASGFVHGLPEVLILDRFLACGLPAVAFPFVNPAGDTVLEVPGVGVEIHMARLFEGTEGFHHSRKFHSIVCCVTGAPRKLLLYVLIAKDGTPTAWPRVARASAVGKNFHMFSGG